MSLIFRMWFRDINKPITAVVGEKIPAAYTEAERVIWAIKAQNMSSIKNISFEIKQSLGLSNNRIYIEFI